MLYDRILNVTPATADDPDRDRLLLSKGHGPASYYAVLAAKGFIPVDELAGFGGFDSPLGHHPDAALLPGVEIASGSLGHGLPIAVGRALGCAPAGGTTPRVICVIGDGELAEGSNHEAIALAGRLGLDRLTAIVVDNVSATYGWPDGVDAPLRGRGLDDRRRARERPRRARARDHAGVPGRPHAVVAVVEALSVESMRERFYARRPPRRSTRRAPGARARRHRRRRLRATGAARATPSA